MKTQELRDRLILLSMEKKIKYRQKFLQEASEGTLKKIFHRV